VSPLLMSSVILPEDSAAGRARGSLPATGLVLSSGMSLEYAVALMVKDFEITVARVG